MTRAIRRIERSSISEARYWAKVERGDNCWRWTAFTRHGYGVFRVPEGMAAAHRVSWVLANGEIPPGLHVCHRCDNPGCVNPAHLFLGTHADNMADKAAKGRARGGNRPGEGSSSARLSAKDVAAIRQAIRDGAVQARLAEQYAVSVANITAIKQGRSWKDAASEVPGFIPHVSSMKGARRVA